MRPALLLGPLARRARDDSGAVAVEFVLIAPILLALVFGIITVGYFMGLTHSIHQLATGAARASVAGLDATERAALAQEYLDAGARRYPLLVQTSVDPTITIESGEVPAISVEVRYDLDGSLLEIANGFLGMNMQTLERTAYLAY